MQRHQGFPLVDFARECARDRPTVRVAVYGYLDELRNYSAAALIRRSPTRTPNSKNEVQIASALIAFHGITWQFYAVDEDRVRARDGAHLILQLLGRRRLLGAFVLHYVKRETGTVDTTTWAGQDGPVLLTPSVKWIATITRTTPTKPSKLIYNGVWQRALDDGTRVIGNDIEERDFRYEVQAPFLLIEECLKATQHSNAPPQGMIGRKEIDAQAMRLHGRSVPNGTFDRWLKSKRNPPLSRWADPTTGEKFVPRDWGLAWIKKWQPGRTAH